MASPRSPRPISSSLRIVASLTTTVPSESEAEGLARGLVEARLAACVQVEPGLSSYYRWQGAVQADTEVRLTIKTLPQARAAVEAFLVRYHPYQLPQVLWQTHEASAAYADWMATEVEVPGPESELELEPISAPAAEDLPPPA